MNARDRQYQSTLITPSACSGFSNADRTNYLWTFPQWDAKGYSCRRHKAIKSFKILANPLACSLRWLELEDYQAKLVQEEGKWLRFRIKLIEEERAESAHE